MSARKKHYYYAASNGQPLGIGLRGLFGLRSGVLIPAKQPALFAGRKSKEPPSLTKLIERTRRSQELLRTSVIHDWAATKPLVDLGPIVVVKQ